MRKVLSAVLLLCLFSLVIVDGASATTLCLDLKANGAVKGTDKRWWNRVQDWL